MKSHRGDFEGDGLARVHADVGGKAPECSVSLPRQRLPLTSGSAWQTILRLDGFRGRRACGKGRKSYACRVRRNEQNSVMTKRIRLNDATCGALHTAVGAHVQPS